MNKTKYMQTDSRWGGLGYPRSPWYIRNCGCGEVSIANCIIEMEQYKAYTPATIQPYCKQYADSHGNGTFWSGIPAMMKHYGLTEVKEHATMSSLWKELAKGDRVAVYLMGARRGGSKGVHWTSGGHFVASVDYRYRNGQHEVYMKDSYSNSSLRNGWISYNGNLKGDVVKVWSGKLNSKKVKPTPSGKLTVDGIGGLATVQRLQEFLGVTKTDGITIRKDLQKYVPSLKAYDYGNGSPTVKAMQKWLGLSNPDGLWGANTSKGLQKKLGVTADGIFGTNSMKALQKYLNANTKAVYPTTKTTTAAKKTTTTSKGQKIANQAIAFCGTKDKEKPAYKAAAKEVYGKGNDYNCHRFVGTVLRKVGYPKMPINTWTNILKYLRKNFTEIKVNFKESQLKNGDIRVYKNSKGGYHIWLIIGTKKKAEANHTKKYFPHQATNDATKKHAADWLFRAK